MTISNIYKSVFQASEPNIHLWLLTSITSTIFSILLSSIVFPFYADEAIAQKDYFEYRNGDDRVKIQYPFDWKASDTGLQDYKSIIAFYSPLENISDTFQENVEISIIPFAENITLGDYNSRVSKGLGLGISSGLEIVESNSTTLADKPAYKVLLSSSVANNTEVAFDVMRIWTVENNKVYSISYLAESARYQHYLPVVERMINSFEIIEDS